VNVHLQFFNRVGEQFDVLKKHSHGGSASLILPRPFLTEYAQHGPSIMIYNIVIECR